MPRGLPTPYWRGVWRWGYNGDGIHGLWRDWDGRVGVWVGVRGKINTEILFREVLRLVMITL